jgi:chromosome segregation ATPase
VRSAARSGDGVAHTFTKQLSQLRNKVDELRARLDAEIKRRKIDGNLLQEAKKARDQVAGELRVLRQQAAKGATELKKALTDAKRREQAGKAAAARVEQLKAEVAKKTAELKQRSIELARSARESVAKAKAIPKEAPPTPAPK